MRLSFSAQYIYLICVKANIKYLCSKHVTRVCFLGPSLRIPVNPLSAQPFKHSICFHAGSSGKQWPNMTNIDSSGHTFKDPCIFCHSIIKVASWNIRGGYPLWDHRHSQVRWIGNWRDSTGLISVGDTPCHWLITDWCSKLVTNPNHFVLLA